MAEARLVYWDSCVFIDRIQRTPGRIDALRSLTDCAERGELRIATSVFAMCEVARIGGVPLPEDQERLIVDFFDNPYIVLVQVDEFVARKTRELIRTYTGLSGRDGVHVASALLVGASVLHTYDDRHLTPLNGVEGLRISAPGPEDGQLLLTGIE